MTYLLEDAEHSRVGVLEGGREKLQRVLVLRFRPSGNPLYATVPFAEHPGWMTLLPAREGLWGCRDERRGRQGERSRGRDGQYAHSERETWQEFTTNSQDRKAPTLYIGMQLANGFLRFPVARGKRESTLSLIGLTASDGPFSSANFSSPFFLHTTKSKMKRRRSICVSTRR